MNILKPFFIFILALGVIISATSYAKKGAIKKKRKPAAIKPVDQTFNRPMRNVFSHIDAPLIGEKTHGYLKSKTLEKLNDWGELITSKMAFREVKNPLYIDNPDLHRLLCFFVNSYVYAAEVRGVPLPMQIYALSESQVQRDVQLTIEIQNVQKIFEQCQKIEVKITPVGALYFNWDTENSLNTISDESPPTVTPGLPREFRNDPFLSELFEIEKKYQTKEAKRDKFFNELTMILLEGIRMQLGSSEPKFTKLIKTAGLPAGKKIAAKAWKEKAFLASLSKDDANIFSISKQQKEIARSLTNLVAIPGRSLASDSFFANAIKDILESDMTVNVKVGKEMIHVGFKLKFQ